jgi:cell wall-associated NlpC family hydrolase
MSAGQATSPLAKVALGAALLAAVGVAGFVPVIGGAIAGDQGAEIGWSLSALLLAAGQACVVEGPVGGLGSQQAVNAGQIVSSAFALSGEDALVARMALMVAWTESGLTNLGPRPGNDGSLGLFQQRGWGTPQQEMDPALATGMFVHALLAVSGWRRLPPWVAAQEVQRSAFVDGSNYRVNWALAGELLARVLANGNQPGSCGQGVPQGVTGPASAHGLPIGYTVPADTGPAHAVVVAWARAQLGKAYVWGAAGPESFDCSGLTLAGWATVGVRLVHYTVDQQSEGVAITATQLMAGDLVLVPGSDSPGPGEAGHVGLYLGDGLVESAVDPAAGVVVQSWQTFVSDGLIALRDPDPADG